MVILGTQLEGLFAPLATKLQQAGIDIAFGQAVAAEPTLSAAQEAIDRAAAFAPDVIIGFGGGSAMDVAKIVAALAGSPQSLGDSIGIDRLAGRSVLLVCLSTTAGTGSEVSPNAIFLNTDQQLKQGIISPFLVPDIAYVDPQLTHSVPPGLTGATGIDALSHCIEAYANRLAHPMIDHYAIAGIKLIADHLADAVRDGHNAAARAAVARGSLYGGFCLGPVNTGAVHALSYPLGGAFGVPHGVANALLLRAVLEFNLPAAAGRYADIAIALGADRADDDLTTATRGLDRLTRLIADCSLPAGLSAVGVGPDDLESMASSAMAVTRLLDRNVRTVTKADAIKIYQRAM